MFYYYFALTIIGIITGVCAGIIGAGAEFLIVPLLTILNIHSSMKTRIGTSLFMLLPPIGIFAAIKYYKEGHVDIFAGLYMAMLFTIFSFYSAKYSYSIKINDTVIRRFFSIFTICIGIYLFFVNDTNKKIST